MKGTTMMVVILCYRVRWSDEFWVDRVVRHVSHDVGKCSMYLDFSAYLWGVLRIRAIAFEYCSLVPNLQKAKIELYGLGRAYDFPDFGSAFGKEHVARMTCLIMLCVLGTT